MKTKEKHQNLGDTAKIVLKRKFISMKVCITKADIFQINNLMMQFKSLGN